VTRLSMYSTPLISHVLHLNGAILRRWSSLARSLIGPSALLLVLAFVAPVLNQRGPARVPRLLLGGLGAACVLAYLATPYTGGGPQGLAFLMGSQLRYALPALLLAAPAAAAASPRLATIVAIPSLVFDAGKDHPSPGFRPDLTPTHVQMAVAALLTAAAVGGIAIARAGVRLPRLDLPRLARPRIPSAVLVTIAGVAVLGTAAYASTGISALPIDALIARSDGQKGPVMAIGVTDVRSLLGARLQLRVVAPGAAAPESLRPPPLDDAALDAALRRDHPVVVIVGTSAFSPATGSWTPPGYVRAGEVSGGAAYVLPPLPTATPQTPSAPVTTVVPPVPVLPNPTVPTVPRVPVP